MLIALCKIKVSSTRMAHYILYIISEANKCSICPEAKKLLTTTLGKKQHFRGITIQITVNNGHISYFSRQEGHFLLCGAKCRLLCF